VKPKIELDRTDRSIVSVLQSDARATVTEIARRVGLSKTPVAHRIKHLEAIGLITGYRAILSPIAMGLSHVTFVEVRLTDTREAALRKFNDAVRAIPQVEECYMIAGGFDYLIKVRSESIEDYRAIMGEKISALPYVAATSSYVAMEAVIDDASLAL